MTNWKYRHHAAFLDVDVDVVLISGGTNDNKGLKYIEIYNPVTTCSLPKLPEARYCHTQDGGLGWPVEEEETATTAGPLV